MKKLLLVHHSHTDIGYTEPQGRIARWHVDFIRQALAIAAEDPGFRWTCETFWGVERFLETASASEREAFASAVRGGNIGLSGSYLNFNELIGANLLRRVVRRAAAYGESVGTPVTCAMTADINGYSWGFAQALFDAGISNLFTCVHTHHGMYPMGRTQIPFWWETPNGDRVLVFSGEHYHFGNELGLVPEAVSSYLTKDDCDADMIFHDARGVAEIRIPRYCEKLEADGWPFDFVPVMASGLRTDNGPPSALILDQIAWWNDAHGDVVRVEMATLEDVFAALRSAGGDWPVARGDWPDWWSDGLAGSPKAVRLFRQAQRDLDLHRLLRARDPSLPTAGIDRIESDLAQFAEHTFSHSDSMGSPWHLLVHGISARNESRAARAFDDAHSLLDTAAEVMGGGGIATGMSLEYRVVNPHPHAVTDVARLPVGHHEFCELELDGGIAVFDEMGRLPRQLDVVPRGGEICVPVSLDAGEESVLLVSPADAIEDEVEDEEIDVLETPFVRIGWEIGGGISEWTDLRRDASLLRIDREHDAFTAIHEITPCDVPDEVGSVRSDMGLDRRGQDAVRSAAVLASARLLDAGDVFVRAELRYDLPGTTYAALVLTAYRHRPRVDVSFRMAKDCRWEPENVFLSLPFTSGAAAETVWLMKSGANVRPRVDQIPGTLTDFYAVQEGFAVIGPHQGVAVAMLDGPLLQLGPIEPGTRLLMGDPALADDPAHAYAWLMTNYWETNFEASLGGFHEFRYAVTWGEELADPDRAREAAAAMGHGLFVVRRREAELGSGEDLE